MTHPLSDLIAFEQQTGACIDCGEPVEQTRIAKGGTGLALSWRPERCEPCAMDHVAQRRADQEQAVRREEQESERTIRRIREDKRDALLDALGCPPLYARATLDTFELHGTVEDQSIQQRAVTIGRRYCADWPIPPHQTLILRGGFGTGKGHWAWSVAKWICAEHVAAVRVVKLADMIRRIRSAWRRDSSETEETVLELFRAPALLVIDEVSRHAFYGEQIHQHLYDVLDHRIEQMRPTILTTNETDQGLAEILRPALVSRVEGTGGMVDFGAASYRARPRVTT